jgi:hypothetical protein
LDSKVCVAGLVSRDAAAASSIKIYVRVAEKTIGLCYFTDAEKDYSSVADPDPDKMTISQPF